jgi:hypothetical protein
MIPLHAVADILDDLPQLVERRRDVQARRRRNDEEIFELFHRPFRPWMHDERYLQASILLRETFGLDHVFRGDPEDLQQLRRLRERAGEPASEARRHRGRVRTSTRRLLRRLRLAR